MALKDFIIAYKSLFDIIFTFVLPFVALYAIGLGIWVLVDLQWIVHQVRINAEKFQNEDNNEGE